MCCVKRIEMFALNKSYWGTWAWYYSEVTELNWPTRMEDQATHMVRIISSTLNETRLSELLCILSSKDISETLRLQYHLMKLQGLVRNSDTVHRVSRYIKLKWLCIRVILCLLALINRVMFLTHQEILNIFGSVKEPKESLCLSVCPSVCSAQVCLKVSIFILEQSGSVSGQSQVSPFQNKPLQSMAPTECF